MCHCVIMSLYEPDELFSLRSSFYIGAYANALNEADSVVADTQTLQDLRDTYIQRAHLACGREPPAHLVQS